jgi:hypothetical protein
MSTLTTPKKDGRRVPTEPAALAKFPKSRCKNCPKFFPKTRPNREFCSEDCKNEYNRNGSAFGPLRERLTKLIERRTKEETAARFEDAYKATALLLAGDASFIRALRAHGFIHRSDLKKPPLENTGAGRSTHKRDLCKSWRRA